MTAPSAAFGYRRQGGPAGHRPAAMDAKVGRASCSLIPSSPTGEAYMDGTLTFSEGSGVGDLLRLFSINRSGLGGHGSQKILRRMLQR